MVTTLSWAPAHSFPLRIQVWALMKRLVRTHESMTSPTLKKGDKQMDTITTKDGTQIYKDRDTGQPLVFSHGWPLSADSLEAAVLTVSDWFSDYRRT
jgi:hypothetical protein